MDSYLEVSGSTLTLNNSEGVSRSVVGSSVGEPRSEAKRSRPGNLRSVGSLQGVSTKN